MTAIWREHEAWDQRRWGEARQHIEQALTLDPDNAYLRYLKAVNDQLLQAQWTK